MEPWSGSCCGFRPGELAASGQAYILRPRLRKNKPSLDSSLSCEGLGEDEAAPAKPGDGPTLWACESECATRFSSMRKGVRIKLCAD